MTNKKYKVGVVSGKFRLLHKAHKEVIVRATLENIEKLVIVIHDLKGIERYSTIAELRIAIGEILKDIDMEYEIIICKEEFSNIKKWEQFVIEKVGHNDILMFNSKEDYENILLDNMYINCKNALSVSATKIEQNPYDINSYEQISKEFMPYINKKIVISGVESSGKTQISIKLSKALNTVYSPEYGRTYASKYLGADDEAFMPKDFVFIAQNQLNQDRKVNKEARRALIVDTDSYVTLRFLKSYYEEYEKRGLITEEFLKEYEDAKSMLETICKTNKSDLIFLLKPDGVYVEDGIRWEKQTSDERFKRFNQLKELYDRFEQPYIIVEGDNYKEKFAFIEDEIEKIMNIY